MAAETVSLFSPKHRKQRQVRLPRSPVSALAVQGAYLYVLHQSAVAVYQLRSLKRLTTLSFADGILSFSLHLQAKFSLIVDKVSLQYPNTDFHSYSADLRSRKSRLLRSKQLLLRRSIDNSRLR